MFLHVFLAHHFFCFIIFSFCCTYCQGQGHYKDLQKAGGAPVRTWILGRLNPSYEDICVLHTERNPSELMCQRSLLITFSLSYSICLTHEWLQQGLNTWHHECPSAPNTDSHIRPPPGRSWRTSDPVCQAHWLEKWQKSK